MENIPVYSSELIELLSKEYPDRSPELDMSDREIFYHKGKIDLVKFLVELQEYQILQEKERN